MIAKINSGAQFAGLVNYANDITKKGTIIASEGVCTSSNESITASFQAQAGMRPDLKNFDGHISLSFSPRDTPKLTDGFMAEVAVEYMKRMGITIYWITKKNIKKFFVYTKNVHLYIQKDVQ